MGVIRIDLNFPLKGLDGKELEGQNANINASMLLGNQIASTNKSADILKWMGWAQSLYNLKPIDVSEHERDEIKKFVSESQTLTILAKHQIIAAIENKVKPLKVEKTA